MSSSPPGIGLVETSHAHVPDRDDTNDLHLPQLHGVSATPDDNLEEKNLDKLEQPPEDEWQCDPINPRNWPPAKKWTTTAIVALYTFVTPLASSIMAPGLPDLAIKYGITNPTVTALTLSIFLLSFAIGPLFAAPLSEVYGRVWVLHIANLFFLAFNLGCAFSPNTASFIVFRLLAGFAGSAPIACGGGVISDLFSERERASAMALYNIGPLIGPAVGPVMGGFMAESVGIQYDFYVVVAICGVAAVLGIPLMRESYAPVIRLRRDKLSPDLEKVAEGHPAFAAHHMNKWAYLWINLKRPVILLTRSFICFILSLYMALIYGIYYLMFATFPNLFSEVYHFSTGISGLTYIGLGFGFISATIFGVKLSGKIYTHLAAKNGGKGKPEMRVPALIFGSLFTPVGLLWYGWSAQAELHFMMPITGTAIFGFGLMTTFLPIQLYLVDTFTYAASATAAASTFRSLLAFAFPLFGQQMFNALGYGGGNSLLAGLAIVIGIPFPIWIYYAGERIRARSSFTH
ncbi:major facilitator superfamily domain-containing protein [Suillus clintonianus]|uniref:major facilitator superfamily domain-containing protein n=1 Tax=Suillus clintonianus TaxID=1904413 RepID=UPI001B876D78|nr:major facilitator superfamily domain-containing protein [Suillus clintonianus]KAG2126280.1 major facilitator superfamily domain-containing protein [Suillus clintonianus]